MDERVSMLQNIRIWEIASTADAEVIKRLYVKENKEGLRAIRIVGTYIGLIVVLIRFQTGNMEGITAAMILALANIAIRVYSNWDAIVYTKGNILMAQGICIETELTTEQKDSFNDGNRRTITHYYATFRMQDGSKYCIDLNEPNFRKLSLNDAFIFTKRHAGRFGFNYYSQHEMEQVRRISERKSEGEIEEGWLSAEGWREADEEYGKKLIAACRPKKRVRKGALFIAIICFAFVLFYMVGVWPLDNRDSIITALILLMTFGLLGGSVLWTSIISYLDNIRLSFGKVYYCNGRCTKLRTNGSGECLAYIELNNGLNFILPVSEKSKVNVGNLRCVNTHQAYKYKNKYIGKSGRFDPDLYEQRLFFIS